MTIQEILDRAVTMLENVDINFEWDVRRAKLMDGLDSALSEISRIFPVQARCRVETVNGSVDLPEQVLVPRMLISGGKRVPLLVEEGKLIAEDGVYTLVYYRKPPVVSEMDLTQVLPYPADVLRALPFYCAALYVMGDEPEHYARLMEQYNTKLSVALGYRPAANVESGGVL